MSWTFQETSAIFQSVENGHIPVLRLGDVSPFTGNWFLFLDVHYDDD